MGGGGCGIRVAPAATDWHAIEWKNIQRLSFSGSLTRGLQIRNIAVGVWRNSELNLRDGEAYHCSVAAEEERADEGLCPSTHSPREGH